MSAAARSRPALSNPELVTLAVYLLGGDSRQVDTEDAAVRANELAPGRETVNRVTRRAAALYERA